MNRYTPHHKIQVKYGIVKKNKNKKNKNLGKPKQFIQLINGEFDFHY